MTQALRWTRPGRFVGYVGVPHGVNPACEELFYSHAGLRGGPAPVCRFLPALIDLVCNREIDPARCSTWTLPLERWPRATAPWTSAIKTLLRP